MVFLIPVSSSLRLQYWSPPCPLRFTRRAFEFPTSLWRLLSLINIHSSKLTICCVTRLRFHRPLIWVEGAFVKYRDDCAMVAVLESEVETPSQPQVQASTRPAKKEKKKCVPANRSVLSHQLTEKYIQYICS
jgi:hypothetical protein